MYIQYREPFAMLLSTCLNMETHIHTSHGPHGPHGPHGVSSCMVYISNP